MRCSSCKVDKTVTVELDGYRLCPSCLGRDGEPRAPRAPSELPVVAAAPPAAPQLDGTADGTGWSRLRENVARRDAERRTRRGGRA